MTTMPSLKERLQPYLPRLTLEWLAEAPGARHRAVEGSLVFADISGFTKLSEKLAKLGTVGAKEGIAEAGEIVVSPEFAARLPSSCVGAAKGEGRLLRKAPAGDAASLVWVLPELPDEVIEGSIPVAIRETLRAAIGEPEHRHVSVAFIHFDGTDELLRREDPSVLAEALHDLVSNTQAAVDTYGVCFLASDV